ncbi:MAG: RNA polymerase sigma factor [Bacteroidota bacterium]|jgi:RNA polymerase sigma-70 factor (ECF subfamily)|nr:RNA polymerase sigma factor [Ignavibacteria bacterium]MCU7501124.1 RNA polymerase sigma factor [Ignavibacteria bacterium]MCU7514517.1 RNA polymerase sigma factor [Ignavibacteria bacterium]MCU7522359.1 RNA polymerase sigma factor [Ignavibacteria bacterium]MCU7525949.1 RNA polymerase sigma factor [Ignavibacteria bacterium]
MVTETKSYTLAANHLLSDEEIVKKVTGGDINFYEVIMRRYNQRLFRIGHAYLRDDDEIEDAIQSAYLKAYEQLNNFQGRSSFSTWLIRIYINELLQGLKKKKRFQNYFDPDLINNSYDPPEVGTYNMETPYNSTLNNELKDILEKAVDELPEKYRVVFIMREIEDMSVSETSKSLNITEANVKVRLNRAKNILRESLSQYYHYKDIYNFNLIRCDRIVANVFKNIRKAE